MTDLLTADNVRRFAPDARADIVKALAGGNDALRAAGIDTPIRLAHFMAQIATETGGFQIYVENMNYTAERLMQVWPSHFTMLAQAQPFAHNPEKLADFIYDDKNRAPAYRLGNIHPGDGWRFRGRGLIQTTGRSAYDRVGHADDPEALSDPAVGLAAAIDEFVRSGCKGAADKDDVEMVRRKINGGLIGIAECRQWLAKAKTVWSSIVPPEPWDAPAYRAVIANGGSPRMAWIQDQLSRLQPSHQPLTADGVLGPNTKRATAAFQTARGLKADGIPGDKTVAEIRRLAE